MSAASLTGSAVYTGQVRHKRAGPKVHAFTYATAMMLFDLDNLPALFKGRWLWSLERPNFVSFYRRDHLRDGAPDLATAIRDLVERRLQTMRPGKVSLLTMPRYLGWCFNPISVYFCHEAKSTHLHSLVVEVHSTPWNEQHLYVLPITAPMADGKSQIRVDFDKAMHVSPFMPMAMTYRLLISLSAGGDINLKLMNFLDDKPAFSAALELNRRTANARNMAAMLVRYPLLSWRVSSAIYWQALRLWLKRVPFYSHPGKHPKTEPPPNISGESPS